MGFFHSASPDDAMLCKYKAVSNQKTPIGAIPFTNTKHYQTKTEFTEKIVYQVSIFTVWLIFIYPVQFFALKVSDPTPTPIKAEMTMKTNFFGTRDICTELLPLMKPQGESD